MVRLEKKIVAGSIILAFTLLNTTAYGASFNYNYADFLMVKLDEEDDFDIDNGYATLGSSPINKDYNAVFEYSKNSGEVKANKKDFDSTIWAIGIEYHQPLPAVSNDADGYARVSYVDMSYDGPTQEKPNGGGSDSDSGFGLEAGVRFKVSNEVEASLGGAYVKGIELLGEDFGDDVDFNASAAYRFSKDVSAVVKTTKFEDWSFGARINF